MATLIPAARPFYFTIILALFLPLVSSGQKIFSLEITGDYREATMIEMFLDLEKNYPIKFYYDPDILPYYKVGYDCKGRNLYNLLQTLLPKHNLTCVAARDNGILICRKSDMNAAYITDLLKKWDDNKIELPEFLTPLELTRQTGVPPAEKASSVMVEGLVNDEQTKEPVSGALIRTDSAGGATTDRFGKFKLALAPGEHMLTVAFLGYREMHVQLQVYQGGAIELPMQVRALELAAVEIQGNKAANKQTAVSTGVELLSTQTIKDLPSFMGESDVVKSLLALPGVSTVGEGSSGFNVRGGNIDQNLVIQDELPFFNTSHVLGFFSVFNPDLVRSTTLYKGHIPAQFGGRIASVLDVKLRDGNFTEWHGSAGAGLASGKASVEGPILKNRLSILAGARSSYSDWMLKLAKLPEVQKSSAWFNDLNVKMSLRSGKNGTISAGVHRSEDYFRFAQQFGYKWKTSGANFAWRQTWGDAVVTSLTGAAGKLENTYFQPEGSDAFDLNNGLEFRTLNLNASLLSLKNHEIQAGAQWNRNNSLPQSLRPRGTGSGILSKNVQQENGEELAFYAGDELKISDRIGLYAGLRYSYFRTLGPNTLLLYEPGVPYSEETVVDSVVYGKNEASQTYGGLEPRVSLNVRLNGEHAIKFSYNRLRQYVHLISNTTAATPTDTWQPSNRYLRPQVSDSYNAGWFFTRDDKRWESSLEIFYRNTADVPAYEDFARLILNDHLETELINGRQRSYGAECLYRKDKGRWTGWVSYTWTRVWQQAQSPYPALSVNGGAWFPANFDQPNQVTMFAKYAINPALYWTFNFTYRTGRPVTAPVNGYQVGNVLVPNFSDRNNLRIPDYHRLDIGLTIDKTKSKLTGLKWTLNLSVYNAYARKNPFSVYFKRDRKGLPKAYQLAVIGSMIPAANLVFYW